MEMILVTTHLVAESNHWYTIGDIHGFACSSYNQGVLQITGIGCKCLSVEVFGAQAVFVSLFSPLYLFFSAHPLQVFRAIRSILNGLVAFLTACNRHRLRFV